MHYRLLKYLHKSVEYYRLKDMLCAWSREDWCGSFCPHFDYKPGQFTNHVGCVTLTCGGQPRRIPISEITDAQKTSELVDGSE